jgi:hypothetical protein
MSRDDLKARATVSRGEIRKERDGTSGGAYYVCINGLAMGTGYDMHAKELADEIARRWNHVANVCEHDWKAFKSPSGGHDATCDKCGLKRHAST